MIALVLSATALAAAVWAVVLLVKTGRRQKAIDAAIALANEREARYDEIGTELVFERSLDMERLVRWLSLSFRIRSYLDDGREIDTWNTPVFPSEYPWGEPMPEAQTMERLFHEVVGPPTPKRLLFGRTTKGRTDFPT